jgi:hypothetical protein
MRIVFELIIISKVMSIHEIIGIEERSFNFAIDIVILYKELKNCNEFVLSKQLLRSGTSIGENVLKLKQLKQKRILHLKCQSLLRKQEKHVMVKTT